MKRKRYTMSVSVTALFVGVEEEEEEQYLYESLLRAENAANNIISGAIVGQKRCTMRFHFHEPVNPDGL